VDYTLTVAVSIAAGAAALTSAFPDLSPARVPICLAVLAVITLLNLRGLGYAARAFLPPTVVFIVGLLANLASGLLHPLALHAAPLSRSLLPARRIPGKPEARPTAVVVPVTGVSRLAQYGISVALSISEDVEAVTVVRSGAAEESERVRELQRQWTRWNPGVPLRVLRTEYASVARPIVGFVDRLRRHCNEPVIVLIPVALPDRLRYRFLHNHVDLVLTRELRYPAGRRRRPRPGAGARPRPCRAVENSGHQVPRRPRPAAAATSPGNAREHGHADLGVGVQRQPQAAVHALDRRADRGLDVADRARHPVRVGGDQVHAGLHHLRSAA